MDVIRAANDATARPRQVVSLIAQLPVEAPAEMTLVGLADWTTYFAVDWLFVSSRIDAAIDRRLQDGLSWSAADDLGTLYSGGDYGGGGGGNCTRWHALTWFAPALDPRATSLTLTTTSPLDGSPVATTVPVRS